MNQDAIRSTELTTETLFSLIDSKLHLLSEMHRMALEQMEMVVQYDMTALMSLLSRKQELMESLSDVQTRLAGFQDQDPERRCWSSPERRKECQANVAKCDQLLKELIVMEDRSLGNMNLHRDSVAAQLQQNIDAATIQNAYQSSELQDSLANSFLSMEG